MNSNFAPIKILLAIGTRIYRDASRELLEKFDHLRVEYAAANIADILTPLNQLSIDLLIIDLHIPGAVEFVTLSEKIRPELKFIVMAVNYDNAQLQKVHNMPGLIGCMQDDMPVTNLIDKINENFLPVETCLINEPSIPSRYPALKAAPPKPAHPQSQLTCRQFKILAMIESGYSNKEISRKLNIETCTVKNHVHNILQRLKANSRCEAAAIFRRAMIGSHYSMAKSD